MVPSADVVCDCALLGIRISAVQKQVIAEVNFKCHRENI